MPDQRKRKLADAVKPIGMRYPFYIQRLGYIHYIAKRILCMEKLVKDDPVKNSLYLDFLSIFSIKQLPSFFDQISEAYNSNVQIILGTIKINFCFLFIG